MIMDEETAAAQYIVPLTPGSSPSVVTAFMGVASVTPTTLLVGVLDPVTGNSTLLNVDTTQSLVTATYTLPGFNSTAAVTEDSREGVKGGSSMGLAGLAWLPGANGAGTAFVANNYDNKIYA